MLVELNNILDIAPTDKLNSEFIVVSDDGRADGTFITHHFLSFFLKSERVCFLAMSQSFSHYQNVALKLGANISASKAENNIVFIEGMKHIGHCIVNNESTTDCPEASGDNPFIGILQGSLVNLFLHLKLKMEGLKNETETTVTLIIDDLSILLSIGVSVNEIISFVNYLRAFVLSPDGCGGSIVVFTNNGSSVKDEENSLIWRYLVHSCSLSLCVSGLSSGYCKEVHGELSVSWSDSAKRKPKKKKFQYKLSDKNVSFFALGLSAAVL